MNDSAGTDGGAAGTAVFARGGTDALADALEAAATARGVQLRTQHDVVAIRTRGDRVQGVTLADGAEVDVPLVVSTADPKRTMRLLDPAEVGPTMHWRGENIRQPGATARVNFALGDLPAFHGGDPERLAGRIVIGPSIEDVVSDIGLAGAAIVIVLAVAGTGGGFLSRRRRRPAADSGD